MGRAFSCVCECVYQPACVSVDALKGNQLELSTPNLVDIESM